MVNVNTPAAEKDSIEKKKNKNRPVDVSNLLKEGIYREMGNPIDPKKFDRFRSLKGETYDLVRVHMYDLRREESDQWGSIEDSEIDGIKGSDINEKILLMARQLIFMRKRAFDRSVEVFPTLRDQGADWRDKLNFSIHSLDENELKNLVTRSAVLRKVIYNQFPDLKNISPSEKRDFEKMFHDIDSLFDEVGKKRVKSIFRNYSLYGNSPDTSDIEFILSGYGREDSKRQKEILEGLGVTLQIKQAFEYGLIDTEFLKLFAAESMGTFYTSLDDEKKAAFIRSLQNDQTYVISAADFNPKGLGEVFADQKKLRTISREIAHTIGIDAPESSESRSTGVIAEILQKKRLEFEKAREQDPYLEEEDYDLFETFIDHIRPSLSSDRSENIKLLKQPGAVIGFAMGEHGTQYIQIKRVRDDQGNPIEIDDGKNRGVEVEGFSILNGKLMKSEHFTLSYEGLMDLIMDRNNAGITDINVITDEEFKASFTKDKNVAESEGKMHDIREALLDPVDASNIVEKIDNLDPEGSEHGFGPGTAFIAPSTEEETGKTDGEDIWTIRKISGNTIDLMDSAGHELVKGFPLTKLFEVLEHTPSFKRVNKITDDISMLQLLQEHGVNHGASMKDGNIIIKEKDDHDHEVEKKVTCFIPEKSEEGHIIVESLLDGRVRFGEYKNEIETDKMKEHIKSYGFDKKAKTHYSWQTMSYPAFLKYLEKNKLKATTKNPVIPDDTAHDLNHGHGDSHHGHPHVHGNFLSRIMQLQNPASIIKGFEMIWHGIEHTLEKGAKLDAAKFALKTAKLVGLPDSVAAQIYADVVQGSKEIVEKYEKKIFDLPGPRAREKALHIVENHDSRPEEIVAAMNFMLKSYGHLYSEDIKYKQSLVQSKEHCINAPKGTFMFFDAFVVSSKIGDLKFWREKAYTKAVAEMGSEKDHEGEPTEEQLIHALFKNIDGDWDQFPYAASVIKAVGGPGGFEKTWKFEGFENAYKKGMDQTKMVNAQGRLNKSVSYLETHEIYKAIGAMESMAAKTKDPKYQAMPFIWAVGGYSSFASHTALQKLKGYAENGLSFHGYAFLRSTDYNNIYRETVKLALREMGGGLEKEFDEICAQMKFDSDKPKKTKGGALRMMKFWQDNYDKGLHDMLQGQNGWLVSKYREGNETVKKYYDTLEGGHAMQLNDNSIPGGTDFGPDWYKEHGYMNIIFSKGPNGLRSLSSMLNKIKFDGTAPAGGRDMNDEHYKKIWTYVVKYMQGGLKDPKYFGGNTALQKEQFLYHREEIIEYMARQMNTRSTAEREGPEKALKIAKSNIENYPFYRDLEKMGIDPMAVFNKNTQEDNANGDYDKWISGTSSVPQSSKKSRTVPDVKTMVTKRSNEAISDEESLRKKKQRNRREQRRNHTRNQETEKTIDDDTMVGGGAADASDTWGE